ncbi:MAG: MFS transporter [Bacteroidales bacterium]|nr:MFS transporter [Bacteroidales bacterium]
MDTTTFNGKLKLKEKLGYGFGDLASVLYWQTFMLYFTYFYTDVFLIPLGVAAGMFLVSRLWDGVNDPMMGILADRTNTRWGKFRPYLLWMCVPFAVAGVLTFTVPNLGMSGKIVWAYVTFILIMMLYTAINIPYTSLLGVISPDSKERTSVSSIKFVFAFAAGIIVSATLLPMTKMLGKDDTSIIEASLKENTIEVSEVEKGSSTIVLTAEDPQGLKNEVAIGFRVDPLESNLPEIINPITTLRLFSGFNTKEINISKVFAGNGKDGFEYKLDNKNPDLVDVELSGDNLIINEKKIGNAKILLTAKDKLWGERTNEFYINVNKVDNNDPVFVDSVDFFRLDAGFKKEEINLAGLIEDPDSMDNLSFFVETDNEKVASPTLHGNVVTFDEGKAGLVNLTVIAVDSNGGQLIHKLTYLVAASENNPPFVNVPKNNIIEKVGFGKTDIIVSNMFVDPEGASLKYSIKVINDAKGWQKSFMIYGFAAIIFFLIAFKSTKERISPPKTQKSSIGNDLKNLFTNKPWLILLFTTITFILFVALKSSVTVHYFKYIIGNQELKLPFLGNRTYDFVALTSAYNTIGQISSLIGAIIVAGIANRIGKKKAFVLLFVIAIFSTGILFFLTAKQLGLVFLFQITGSMTGGPLSVLIWAMYADTADYSEWKSGTRSTGLIFSASTMSQKVGWAIGAYVALTLMAQLGFQPNMAQSTESLRGLLLLFSLIPAGMGIVSLFISISYPLHDKRVKEITTELAERRKFAGATE